MTTHLHTRLAFAALMMIAGTAGASAQADPYRWCADYGGFRGGGGSNCYFMTLQQCQATISGVGGTCRPNPFFTGPAKEPQKQRRNQQKPAS